MSLFRLSDQLAVWNEWHELGEAGSLGGVGTATVELERPRAVGRRALGAPSRMEPEKEQPMRRQMTPKDQLEDLERRESVLKEEA